MTDETAPAINLTQIYCNAASFSHRGEPLNKPGSSPQPPQRCEVRIVYGELNNGEAYQVRVTVASDPNEADVLCDFSVEMIAILELANEIAKALPVAQVCEIGAAFLYPYIRETVQNLTSRGRFAPVLLNPFNIRAAVSKGLIERLQIASSTPAE